jgi:hypothetical protein
MRIRNVSMLAAAVAAMGLSVAASASTLTWLNDPGYTGPLYIKYSNFDAGRIYPLGTNTALLPAASGVAAVDAVTPLSGGVIPTLPGSPNNTEDTWGVALVDTIYEGTNNTGTLLYSKAIQDLFSLPTIKGLYWGGQDIQVLSGTSETVYTTAIQMSFYYNSSTFPSNGGSPDFRTTPGGVPTFAGVTNTPPLWTMKGTVGISAANPYAQMYSTIDPTLLNTPAGTSVGGGGITLELATNDSGTGSQNNLLQGNPAGPDVIVQFTDYTPPAPPTGHKPWTVTSSDPAQVLGSSIPTPAAVWGGAVLAGMVALNVYRRRRSAE